MSSLPFAHTTVRTLVVALRGALSGHRRMLLASPRRADRLSVLDRILLGLTDGIVASADSMRSLIKLGIPKSRIIPEFDEKNFAGRLQVAPEGGDTSTSHLIYAGELSPRSGCADFLACVTAWAHRNPTRSIIVTWVGDGNLRGLLQAQPIPTNLKQRFVPELEHVELIALFESGSIFIVPSLHPTSSPNITSAMACGLPVLGSVRSVQVRALVQPDNGWLFDPLKPGSMATALNTALWELPARFEEMRSAAHARGRSMHHRHEDTVIGAVSSSDTSERVQQHDLAQA